jgi:hypothetical protein
MTTIRPARAGWLAAAVLAGAAATGCGGGSGGTGSVAGTVTHAGSPVRGGNLNLISKAGSATQAKIDDDGTFKADGRLPAGDYAAYVTPPEAEPAPPGTKAPAPKKFGVPPKFQSPTTSGVTVSVKGGSNDLKVDFQ